ncbi:hypothetical protein LCGC14_0567770 [marine sediment metagenome]|uniref:Uncharacterized protein n=1 Tax=marine sediment metagenome TaxID=412755 RepID=A0A0F9S3P1_9ZZZZ
MALHARRSGTGRPARLSVAESEAILNRLNLSRAKFRGDTTERETLLHAIGKLVAVVHGPVEEEARS